MPVDRELEILEININRLVRRIRRLEIAAVILFLVLASRY